LEKKKKRKKDAVGRELQWTQGCILWKIMSAHRRLLFPAVWRPTPAVGRLIAAVATPAVAIRVLPVV
jgi:hypothetical protein